METVRAVIKQACSANAVRQVVSLPVRSLERRISVHTGAGQASFPAGRQPLMGTEERRLQNGAGSQRSHTRDVDLCRGVALAILPLHTRLDPQKI
ncbi:hypothetical protein T11_5591 [Trichinella zimbabwensis]|uniref:Uncharacterized protein n=1 Tax=Trichinella zimbabwensis TaxID=268475 RepID=A0A0V1I639_9BILA|nr:hypothetical protein T11_5591 [Trichinella zimbabwensis]